MPFGVVEWSQILQVIGVSLVMGVGVTALFAVVVYGSSRAAESRRAGDGGAAYGALAAVSMLAFAAVVVFAITVILEKS